MLLPNLPAKLNRFEVDANGCWNWTGSYWTSKAVSRPKVALARKWHAAHREVYKALVGPIPEGLTLDHLCENPPCVNPAHLEPCTLSENSRRYQASSKKLRDCERRSGSPMIAQNRVLTDAQVLAIYCDRRPPAIVATEYGVNDSTARRIRNGKRWSQLTGHSAQDVAA